MYYLYHLVFLFIEGFILHPKIYKKRQKKNRVIIDKQYLYEDHSLPGRYATALYRVCIQKTCLEDVWSDIESLRDCMKESKDFKQFLESPGISIMEKVGFVQSMATKFHLNETTTNFLNLLLENRRLSFLRKIIDSFENFYRASRGEIKCLVTSAMPLDSIKQMQIMEALKKRKSENQLMISFAVSPSIIGGLTIRLGDQTLDYSVASRLAHLQSEFLIPLTH